MDDFRGILRGNPTPQTVYLLDKLQKSPGIRGFRDCAWQGQKESPLAVPEKRCGLTPILAFFDRCANPCSLLHPPDALAGAARHAVLEVMLENGSTATPSAVFNRLQDFCISPSSG